MYNVYLSDSSGSVYGALYARLWIVTCLVYISTICVRTLLAPCILAASFHHLQRPVNSLSHSNHALLLQRPPNELQPNREPMKELRIVCKRSVDHQHPKIARMRIRSAYRACKLPHPHGCKKGAGAQPCRAQHPHTSPGTHTSCSPACSSASCRMRPCMPYNTTVNIQPPVQWRSITPVWTRPRLAAHRRKARSDARVAPVRARRIRHDGADDRVDGAARARARHCRLPMVEVADAQVTLLLVQLPQLRRPPRFGSDT